MPNTSRVTDAFRHATVRYTTCCIGPPGSRLRDRKPDPLITTPGYEEITDEDKDVLRILDVDLDIPQNTSDHHTDKYEVSENSRDGSGPASLVIRRGRKFNLSLKLSRPFEIIKDDLKIIFETSESPKASRGTSVTIVLSDYDQPGRWTAEIKSHNVNGVTIAVSTPYDCIVGKWSLQVDTFLKYKPNGKAYRYFHKNPVYILFNPWCPDDGTYMSDEEGREEYILNDVGMVFAGTHRQIFAKPWNFAQFEDFVLDCVFYLLDRAKMPYRLRGSPVHVVRKISAIVNTQDEGGLLVGNWSGDFGRYTNPIAWTGSEAIIEEFWRTKQSVRYGQCWVFSGLVTTVCRAIGIPSRCVTNFASAHDTDGSITVDTHWDANGSPMTEYNADSIWNFHVWNDVWMARPDLPSGYGGWQAIDATPQETSEGTFCCGPASLEAIKQGMLELPYDGPFIFAEVNADRINWLKQSDGTWNKNFQKNIVGKNISTKRPGKGFSYRPLDDREDITHQYKFLEGSRDERAAVLNAFECSTLPDLKPADPQDVAFDLIEKDGILIGEPFEVSLRARNITGDNRTVNVTLTACVVYYTGVIACKIKTQRYNVKVQPYTDDEIIMTVAADEYLNKLVDQAAIKISCMATVEETKQVFTEQDDFRLSKPDLKISALEEVKVGSKLTCEISFANPLNTRLTKNFFFIEGPGLQRSRKITIGDVLPHSEAHLTVDLYPRRTGFRQLIASFNSKELTAVTGQCHVNVIP
ncbi:hemocyte protein-glutamine gamma-glutamyltransferase-like [Tubulanus polymorphus]|uniref:hemocyte protein-glutamine gamma-glutamyltransferase-like n=1 Tax=Tubulanus polymorphus TaxID=672921 RepID=UPI003DA57ADF